MKTHIKNIPVFPG